MPVRDEASKLISIQFINCYGKKRFLVGGKKAGCFFSIPAQNGDKVGPLLIAEGYATAASLRESSGYAALVAFNCGNLLAVAEMARRLYPEREIILCADNDASTKGNPGLTKATAAARAVSAKLAVPPLEGRGKMDFNDLYQLRGALAVREAVQAAVCPALEQNRISLRVLNLRELLNHEAPKRDHVLYPVIPEQGLCMLFAERGVGKTFVGLNAAYTVASGGTLFSWRCDKSKVGRLCREHGITTKGGRK